MMRIIVFFKENYQQVYVGGGLLFLICEVIFGDKQKKLEFGLLEIWRQQVSFEFSLILLVINFF